MAIEAPLWTDTPVRPGEILKDTLEGFGMTGRELALRMGRPPQAISEIINGGKCITEETALQLESVLGTPADVWVNLERNYQFNRARAEQERKLALQTGEAQEFPFAAMARLGLLEPTRDQIARVRALLRFFGVADLSIVRTRYSAAFRKSTKKESSPHALAAWLRAGEIQAAAVSTERFSSQALKVSLLSVRRLTGEMPAGFADVLGETLARAGVAVVFVPHLPKTYANGATFWLDGRPVIQLSLRGTYDDRFWFTVFHEAGHLVLHGKQEVFIEDSGLSSQQEEEADTFARDILIPPDRYHAFVRGRQLFPEAAVREFARDLGISTGIVVGRLQHDHHLPPTHLNGLKRKLVWAE